MFGLERALLLRVWPPQACGAYQEYDNLVAMVYVYLGGWVGGEGGKMKRYSARSFLRRALKVGCVLMLLEAGTLAFAQEAASPPARHAPTQTLSQELLDNLVAPITLYPDSLFSQVLLASDPLKVVEAQHQQNGNLCGAEVRTDAAHPRNDFVDP